MCVCEEYDANVALKHSCQQSTIWLTLEPVHINVCMFLQKHYHLVRARLDHACWKQKSVLENQGSYKNARDLSVIHCE